MCDTGGSGRLRFESEGQAATSDQLGPKPRKRTAPEEGGSHNMIPPDAPSIVENSTGPILPDTVNRKIWFEDEAPSDTFSSMGGTSATSGQFGLKSGKLRRDSKKPRSPERLWCDGGLPPGDGSVSRDGSTSRKAAQDGKCTEESKFRMEKSGEKLNTAREKLAAQKLPKKPGSVKAISRVVRYQSRWYVYGKIHRVKHENAGTETIRKVELIGEHLVRDGTRFIRYRIRTRPIWQVRKWENKHISARADYTCRQLVKENPDLQSNPVSRFWQKRRLKERYRK